MINGIRNIILFICLFGIFFVGNIAAAQDFDIMDIVKQDLNQRVAPSSDIDNSFDSKKEVLDSPDMHENVDFYPYMRELQRRIKINWNPPKESKSNKVVLVFKIAKDGRLLSCSVAKSSGLQKADQAALDAVKNSAPFRALPKEYRQSSVDIQFNFDYNVFGSSNLPW